MLSFTTVCKLPDGCVTASYACGVSKCYLCYRVIRHPMSIHYIHSLHTWPPPPQLFSKIEIFPFTLSNKYIKLVLVNVTRLILKPLNMSACQSARCFVKLDVWFKTSFTDGLCGVRGLAPTVRYQLYVCSVD